MNEYRECLAAIILGIGRRVVLLQVEHILLVQGRSSIVLPTLEQQPPSYRNPLYRFSLDYVDGGGGGSARFTSYAMHELSSDGG